VINYRGLAGAPLTTPRLYTANNWEDILEPMQHVYDKYCKGQNKKAYAIGLSMGANILGNMLGYQGENCFLEAACIVNSPMKMWQCEPAIRTSLYGTYNKAMGGSLRKLLINHESVLNPTFKQAVGSDIKTYLASHETSILTFDNDITCPMNGYKDRVDYYDRASSSHRIPSIKIPTFFLNALDDPVVHK